MNPLPPNDPTQPSDPSANPPEPLSEQPQAPYGQQSPPPQPLYGYPPASQPPNWPQAPMQQPGFGGPGYYPEQVNGGTILTLGIVAFFCAGIILGPIAWVMGNNALKAIDAGRADPLQRSNAVAGRICGIIATILAGIMIVVYGIAFTVGLIQGINHPGSYSSP